MAFRGFRQREHCSVTPGVDDEFGDSRQQKLGMITNHYPDAPCMEYLYKNYQHLPEQNHPVL